MLAEFFGGIFSSSLALIADSAHMLIDTTALILVWWAFKLATKPADNRKTYGHQRFQILAAFVNGLTLFLIAGWIFWEAAQRIIEPSNVLGEIMLPVAIAGFIINLLVFWLLHKGDTNNLNMQGAIIHVLGDLLGSVATIVAAIIIIYTGWMLADPILSVLVGLIILYCAWKLVRDSGHILLEGSPINLSVDDIINDLEGITGVTEIHHVHIWSLTQETPLVTLHAQITEEVDHEEIIKEIKNRLDKIFEISHVTVQIEHEECLDHSH